jgi:hypothetical protein
MGRNAKASSSKLPTRQSKEGRKVEKKPIPREPESEAESASDDEVVDEDDLLEEVEEEEEGIAQYAPDDWDGEDDAASGSGSETGSGSEEEDGSASESEDDGKEDLVCPLSPLIVRY